MCDNSTLKTAPTYLAKVGKKKKNYAYDQLEGRLHVSGLSLFSKHAAKE